MRKLEVVACSLFLGSPWLSAQTPGADGNWPRVLQCCGARLLISQPQIDNWKNNHLEARSAVAVTDSDGTLYGIVSLSARTEVDKESRMVRLEELKVTDVAFPTAGFRRTDLADLVRQRLSIWPRTISLDRLLADLSLTQAEAAAESVPLKNEPPRIIFSSAPSVLILIDGEPVFRPVPGSPYTHVLNTPSLLLFNSAAGRFYLDGVQWWMTATSLNGPWSVAKAPPSDLEKVKTGLQEGEEQDPHAHLQDLPQIPPAVVYVSTVPAELIETTGDPRYSPIPKTQLSYVTNTDRDIFMEIKGQMFYVLLSGRWFQAKTLLGPWSFVSGAKLPRDFAMIPPQSAKGHVLGSVPGTEQAREAVIANQVPQTASVKRSEAKLKVRYDGAPQFKTIPGTPIEYAINTDNEVIRAEGRYWACRNAVWFVADSPVGPWEVTDYIPARIYTIPPSSPLFHLRYVSVYGCTPESVYFGYTPGYLGAFVSDGIVVYGTGWWYPGWYGKWWFGWPWTWGFGYQFSYWSGGWFWRPVGFYWWYHNPWFAHRVYYEHWNPQWHPGDRDWVHNNVNVYNRWPRNTVAARAYLERPAGPARSQAGARRPGDFYVGGDGQVYEHRPEGWYQQNNSGAWRSVTPDQRLDQQRQSRSLGQARQGEFQGRGQAPGIPSAVAPPRMAAPSRPAAPPARHR